MLLQRYPCWEDTFESHAFGMDEQDSAIRDPPLQDGVLI